MAENLGVLTINLADGNQVQFVLPTQKPVVCYENSVMTVTYLSNTKEEATLTMNRDDVESIKVGVSDINAITNTKKQTDQPITFNLTRPGVVSVGGLKGNDRLQVFDLQGKSIKGNINRDGDKAIVNLSNLKRGVYMVSVNQHFTFKLMKP
jgi:hypothetical protein